MSFEVDTGGFTTSQPQTLTPTSSPTFAGLTLSSMTQGSVLFAGASGVVSQDNAAFFYDATAHGLRIGSTANPGSSWTRNIFTNASNYEIAYNGDWGVTANVTTYGTGKAGTGSTRGFQFTYGGTSVFDYGVTTSNAATLSSSRNGPIFALSPTAVGAELYRAITVMAPNITAAQSVGAQFGVNGASTNDSFILNFVYAGAGSASNTFNIGAFGGSAISIGVTGLITVPSTTLLASSVALTNGAAAQIATMTNGPTAGNPTKWVPINDNGTTRYIPAW